jgi:hypothetical protein
MGLLFEFVTWHGSAKLRLHIDSTLDALDNSTTCLGDLLCLFTATTCEEYDTRELPAEEAVRGCHKAARVKTTGVRGTNEKTFKHGLKFKHFNMNTYKIHALGSYVKAIHMYGTTDSYTTQPVSRYVGYVHGCAHLHMQGELEHRRVKQFYPQAHKGQHTHNISKQQ